MCGRYTPPEDLAELLERLKARSRVENQLQLFNAAPGQRLPIVTEETPLAITQGKWGLIPPWNKDPKSTDGIINTRAETISEKPSFRHAFRTHHCLVLASSFFEWNGDTTPKTPYLIRRKDKQPFAFAGIWEYVQDMPTFSIITTSANSVVAPIHERMPVMLPLGQETRWLDMTLTSTDHQSQLRPAPDDILETFQVSTLVNSPKNNTPDILLPV